MNFKGIIKSIGSFLIKKSDTILTVVSCAGVVTTAIMTARATVIVIEDIEATEKEEGITLTKKEIIKTYWKDYIPPVIMGAGTIACIIGSHSISARRQLALASAYTLAENSLKEYQQEVKEMIGEKKEKAVRDKIAENHLKDNPIGQNEVIITGSGETLCYDNYSGRYFKSDIDKIRKVENQLNKRLLNEMFISLNEFYYEVGLAPVQMGNELGWNINEEGLIDIHYSAQLADGDNPCLCISYVVGPRFKLGDF